MAKQKKTKIGEAEYTLQKVPPRSWMKLKSEAKDRTGNTSEEKLYDLVLEHIVVEPKVSIDDFEDFAELEELVMEAVEHQTGASFR